MDRVVPSGALSWVLLVGCAGAVCHSPFADTVTWRHMQGGTNSAFLRKQLLHLSASSEEALWHAEQCVALECACINANLQMT